MVILLFEKLKGIVKDHPKKSGIKTPKIDPIFRQSKTLLANQKPSNANQKPSTVNYRKLH